MQYDSQNARFSDCGDYRYSLQRRWNRGSGRVLFVGLNPASADADRDDPTIRRCVGFARDWGFREMEIVNLFAYRAGQPRLLRAAADPVGPDNDLWIRQAADRSQLVIACWGCWGNYLDRASAVMTALPSLSCLRVNRAGQPTHPLYLPKGLQPRRFLPDKLSPPREPDCHVRPAA